MLHLACSFTPGRDLVVSLNKLAEGNVRRGAAFFLSEYYTPLQLRQC